MKINKFIFAFSTLCLVTLFAVNDIKTIKTEFFVCLITLCFILRSKKTIELNKKDFLLSIFLFVLFSFNFVLNWYDSYFVEQVGLFLGLKATVLAPLIAMLCCPSVIAIACFIKYVTLYKSKITNNVTHCNKITVKEIIICLLLSLIFITLFSTSSPIYPTNTWVDANIYFTMGKMVANGKVMYLECFDHKGPLIYFIHSVGYLISNDSFFGIYLIEILFSFITLIISLKVLKIYIGNKAIDYIPVLCLLLYSTKAFADGDSAEEYMLPFLMYSLYIFIKYINCDYKILIKDWICLGAFAAIIFWTKYTLLGLYIGIGLILVYNSLKYKKIKDLLKILALIIIGFFIITIPIFCYFICNGALTNLFEVYFYDNLFLYKDGSSMLGVPGEFIAHSFSKIFLIIPIQFCLLFVGLNLVKNNREYEALTVCLISTIYFGLCLSKAHKYYYLILYTFSPWMLIALLELVNLIKQKNNLCRFKNKTNKIAIITVCVLLSCLFSQNFKNAFRKKDSLDLYKIKNIIEQDKNKTFIENGMDYGLYTIMNVVPEYKYYCLTNMPLQEAYDMHKDVILNGKVNYIVKSVDELPEGGLYEKINYNGNSLYLYRLKNQK